MGLDIYHYKVTTEKLSKSDVILLKELSSELASKFKQYSKRELVDSIYSLIAIVDELDEIPSNVIKHLSGTSDEYTDYKLILAGTLESCKQQINQFVVANKLEKLGQHIFHDAIVVDGKEYKITDIAFEGELEQNVLHASDVGYQRKGMGSGFYKYFETDTYYSDKESFEALISFCDPDNHMYDPENIRTNFVEKYEYGKSLLYVSY